VGEAWPESEPTHSSSWCLTFLASLETKRHDKDSASLVSPSGCMRYCLGFGLWYCPCWDGQNLPPDMVSRLRSSCNTQPFLVAIYTVSPNEPRMTVTHGLGEAPFLNGQGL